MSYSEMLHEFMENELPTNREETLFHALARDEDLRFEMKYLLSLRNAVQEDDEAGVVPLATTQSLFSRLGYAAAIPTAESVAGATGAAGAASAGAGSGFGAIFRGWGSHLLAGLVGMLLAGSFFVISEPADRSNNGAIAENRSNGDRTAAAAVAVENGSESIVGNNARGVDGRDVAPTAEPSAPSASLTASAVPSRSTAVKRRTQGNSTRQDVPSIPDELSANSPVASNAGNGLIDTTSEASGNATTALGTDNAPETDRSVELTPAVAVASTPTAPNEFLDEDLSERVADRPVQLPKQEYETYGHFNFTARGSMVPVDLTKSKLGIDMGRGDGLNRNFALGIDYAVRPDLSVGLEVGIDSYLMYFREERANGIINEYEAFSSPLWINATGRWSPLEVGPFPLFVQGSFGGGHAGVTTRLMIGGEFNLEESVTLIGGAELSTVGYQYQNELLFSPRFGLTGGIRLNNLFRNK